MSSVMQSFELMYPIFSTGLLRKLNFICNFSTIIESNYYNTHSHHSDCIKCCHGDHVVLHFFPRSSSQSSELLVFRCNFSKQTTQKLILRMCQSDHKLKSVPYLKVFNSNFNLLTRSFAKRKRERDGASRIKIIF